MATVRIEQSADDIVIHFQTELQRINAYTLASTLVSIADAAKAANEAINPGYDIEVVVEALGGGSCRARLKTIYTKANNLFKDHVLGIVILAVISNYLYEKTIAPSDGVTVEIKSEEVIITKGNDRIIVPRQVYEATRKAEKHPSFRGAIVRAAEAISADQSVEGVAFVPRLDSPPPEFLIHRDSLLTIAAQPAPEEPETRIVTETCDLVILKAILERGKRKWEFVWRGVKISAPILDDSFFLDFIEHRITIAPGDELKVRLAITQTRDPRTGIYTNESYAVVEVIDHVPAVPQGRLGPMSE